MLFWCHKSQYKNWVYMRITCSLLKNNYFKFYFTDGHVKVVYFWTILIKNMAHAYVFIQVKKLELYMTHLV